MQRHIPPGPLLKLVNTKLQDMREHGIEVLDYPLVGPPEKIHVYPLNLVRVGDFPGPRSVRVGG